MDPLAEMDYSVSPYAYCAGNPVNMIDPTGMMGESSTFVLNTTSTFVDKNNVIIEHRNDRDPTVYMVENEKEWRANGSSKVGLERTGDEDPWVNYDNEIGNQYKYFEKHDNWIDDLAMHMRNSGWEDKDKAFLKAFGPIIMGLVMYNPLISATNDAKSVIIKTDIYENNVSEGNVKLSVLSLITSFTPLKVIGKTAKKVFSLIDTGLTTFSAASITQTEINKEKKNKTTH